MVHSGFCPNDGVTQLLPRSNVTILFVRHHFKQCISDLFYERLTNNGPEHGMKTTWALQSSSSVENLGWTSQWFSKGNHRYVTLTLTLHFVYVYLISRFSPSPSVRNTSPTSVLWADDCALSSLHAFCILPRVRWIDKPGEHLYIECLIFLCSMSHNIFSHFMPLMWLCNDCIRQQWCHSMKVRGI